MWVSFPFSTRTSGFPTTTLHHEINLAHASFPAGTSTSALPKKKLHHDENLAHASFPSIMKESTNTSPFPTTMLHCEGNHKCISKNNITLNEKLTHVNFTFNTKKIDYLEIYCT